MKATAQYRVYDENTEDSRVLALCEECLVAARAKGYVEYWEACTDNDDCERC